MLASTTLWAWIDLAFTHAQHNVAQLMVLPQQLEALQQLLRVGPRQTGKHVGLGLLVHLMGGGGKCTSLASCQRHRRKKTQNYGQVEEDTQDHIFLSR